MRNHRQHCCSPDRGLIDISRQHSQGWLSEALIPYAPFALPVHRFPQNWQIPPHKQEFCPVLVLEHHSPRSRHPYRCITFFLSSSVPLLQSLPSPLSASCSLHYTRRSHREALRSSSKQPSATVPPAPPWYCRSPREANGISSRVHPRVLCVS